MVEFSSFKVRIVSMFFIRSVCLIVEWFSRIVVGSVIMVVIILS